jgi:diaminopimelate decarboxylase
MSEAGIGDLLVFGGAGAYCSSLSAKNYNSFPEAAEVMISTRGSVELIRKRQLFDQITRNEIIPSFLKGQATCRNS